jgi:hypothetical protein
MFDILYHADWSKHANKRWVASATFAGEKWTVDVPRKVGASEFFLDELFEKKSRGNRVLAGFDFPIGVPLAYGSKTGFGSFPKALMAFGTAPGWQDFFCVADSCEEIKLERPFFPRRPRQGVRRDSLVVGLGVESFKDLIRECEKGGNGRRAACALFWTLGGNQVGKGALTGWQEIVRPALKGGALLWPFAGRLEGLASLPCLVIAETYPADAYACLGASFGPGESKRRPADRKKKAAPILNWAAKRGVRIDAVESVLRSGFYGNEGGEDAFDALAGLLAMISVVKKDIAEASVKLPPSRAVWEGWILGR